ncbi:MAG: hypothetical protein ACLUD1_05805 [Clostridia bacterium]
MNYQDYDEYMRSLIGYPNMRTSMSPSMFSCPHMEAYSDDLERMYPEVYRVVYPMVCVACDNIRTPVTEEMIDMMTDDIYDRVEADGRINVDISVEVRNAGSGNEEIQENRQRRPRRRNRFLRDLIRILLLRELLRRRPRFPFRPF